ncbi:3,9-dihydroxypterocarpan 6A-monooxygenase-like [Lolium rigidum]|uniref:3,9-dihydroxypterocarpan 6A-monooxygenase-like n=1 Tax=Lolium rigidum TaxID=89674 RepID=UPI001F5D1693|nr:3,9-dihydroxypterocarpan 6A-monooxygenase-like [Lolium rigidum]
MEAALAAAQSLFTPAGTSLPLLLLVAGATAVLYAVINRRSSGGLRLPPSPFGLPILGHLHLLAPLPHQALHRLAERHGPLLFLRLGSVPCISACSPDAAREVLKTHEAAFLDRPKPAAVHRLTYGGQDFSFAPYGPFWRFMKKACVHELLAGRTLDRLAHVRREEVARLVASLSLAAPAPVVDVNAALMGLTGDIVSRMVMSRRWTGDDNGAEEFRCLVAETAVLTGTFNLQDYIGAFRNWDVQGLGKRVDALHRKFDAMMERILTAREAKRRHQRESADAEEGAEEKDILDILFDMHEDKAAEMPLSRDNMKAFMLDIFAAGTDTTTITVEWALSELINNPDVLRRAQEEMDAVVGKDRLADESDIPNLPYLQAVAKETLRLHPTGPLVVRQSPEQCKVGEYDVPAGATIFVNVWAIGRDPSSWTEPLEFRPERFLDGGANAGTDVRGQHFHMLPFGSGRRICPGASLALLVVQSALAAMVQCFEWRPAGGADKVDMEEGPGLTLPRKRPLVCAVAPRLHPLPLP